MNWIKNIEGDPPNEKKKKKTTEDSLTVYKEK
jgi:hypothetical protein